MAAVPAFIELAGALLRVLAGSATVRADTLDLPRRVVDEVRPDWVHVILARLVAPLVAGAASPFAPAAFASASYPNIAARHAISLARLDKRVGRRMLSTCTRDLPI